MLGQMGQEQKQSEIAQLLAATPQESKHSHPDYQSQGKAKYKLSKNPSTQSISSQNSQISNNMTL